MGLPCSSGDTGDGSFPMKGFLAVVTPCILLLAMSAPGSVTSGQVFIKDLGDNKEEEDGCLLPGRGETLFGDLVWKALDD